MDINESAFCVYLLFYKSHPRHYLNFRTRTGTKLVVEEGFLGDIVTGGFHPKTKRWLISYFSDSGSEDLNYTDMKECHVSDTKKASYTVISRLYKVFTDDDDNDTAQGGTVHTPPSTSLLHVHSQ